MSVFDEVCNLLHSTILAVTQLRRLVVGFKTRSSGFETGPFHVGLVVDYVALGQISLPVLRFSTVSVIPPLLNIHSCISHLGDVKWPC
jgi:hypothetical protein